MTQKLEVENRLMNWSDNIKEQIADFCVKINEKRRWFVYICLKTLHTLYITMECLQSHPAIVLFSLISTTKKNEIPLNQIMRVNLMHVVDEKVPEVHMNPFTVFYRTKSAKYLDKFGTINFDKTSMGVPGLKFILKQIILSPISPKRIAAVQNLHSIIVQKNRSQDRHVKRWINLSNAARKEKGGSLIYLAFNEVVQEAVVVGQEAGET